MKPYIRLFLCFSLIYLVGFSATAQAGAIFNTNVTAAVRVVDIIDLTTSQSINPSGDPLGFGPYLSIQGDYTAPPSTSVVTTGSATGAANATQAVKSGGTDQTTDIAGNPLGDGNLPNNPTFKPLGAAIDKDPNPPGPGLNIQEGVRLSANVSGQSPAPGNTANAAAETTGWVFIDNQLGGFFGPKPVKVKLALDYEYSGSTTSNQHGTSINIRLLDNLAQDLITPITDAATGTGAFSKSDSILFDITVGTDPFGFDAFKQLNLTIKASGRAESVPEPNPLLLGFFGMIFIGLLDAYLRRLHG